MAASIAQFAEVSNWFSDPSSDTLTGLAWSSGDEIVVFVGTDGDEDFSLPTNANLTFTQLQWIEDTGSQSVAYLWSATAGTSETAQTITLTKTFGTGNWGAAGWVNTGANGTGVTGGNQTLGATPGILNLTVAADSVVIHAYADWNAVAPDTRAPATGSGTATERFDDSDQASYSFWGADWSGTAAGTFGFGPDSYTGLKAAQVAVEVLAAAGGTLDQDGFQFYDDDAAEGAATDLAAEDTNITIAKATPFRLRTQVDTTGDVPSGQFKLQYRKVGDAASEWEDLA